MNSKTSNLYATLSLAVTKGWLDIAEESRGLTVHFSPTTSVSKSLVLAIERLARRAKKPLYASKPRIPVNYGCTK